MTKQSSSNRTIVIDGDNTICTMVGRTLKSESPVSILHT